eukprot:CAMPEP_0175144900 /NCGR_PEP_ID=MMETSP0087-20121206/14436_1 /TAXON_ID=136419 /ORGANISM="Unknown Unknown, Strain D1" /LENGTH=79 /DNA_ID=CAMNT_0016429515 /DNA_START=541 /DNA_END=776 /DNA_ORIENTATION=-
MADQAFHSDLHTPFVRPPHLRIVDVEIQQHNVRRRHIARQREGDLHVREHAAAAFYALVVHRNRGIYPAAAAAAAAAAA